MRLSIGTALAALLTVTPAAAEQFVVAEATYTHSAQTTKDSHYFVEPSAQTPDDWTEPVDYANGSVHVRLEVKTKPSSEPTRYQICFEMKQNYCCTDQAPPYTAPGIYEWDTKVEDLWRPGPVDFAQGIVRNALILKDTENVKPAPENVGEETSQLYMPSDLSVTVTVVSAGSEFMPPDLPMAGGGSSGSGGGGASGMAGGGVSGSPAGEPGASGSGGAAGSSGAPVTPEPAAGTGPAAPSGGAAGATNMLPAAANTADSGGCSFSARPRAAPLGLLALLGACAIAERRARRRRPSSTHAARLAR